MDESDTWGDAVLLPEPEARFGMREAASRFDVPFGGTSFLFGGKALMVHFVGAGPGAPDLITLRGARLLREADQVIYTGSLVNTELLSGCR
ncbi:MAG: SAM-dependent methyltransferase, partial [Succinimonas sp.]|nr:SAM-dependent methyltransferase [Succinimonas sp.]